MKMKISDWWSWSHVDCLVFKLMCRYIGSYSLGMRCQVWIGFEKKFCPKLKVSYSEFHRQLPAMPFCVYVCLHMNVFPDWMMTFRFFELWFSFFLSLLFYRLTFSLSFSHLPLCLLSAIMFAVGYVLLVLILPPATPLSFCLSPLFLPLLFLVFMFGKWRLCRHHVFGENDCVFLPCCRITSSTWASWGCSEQLVSSSCWDRERPFASCCGPSSSPLRYSVVNRYTHKYNHNTLHSADKYFLSLSGRLCHTCVCSSPCSSSSMPSLACRWVLRFCSRLDLHRMLNFLCTCLNNIYACYHHFYQTICRIIFRCQSSD